MTIEEMKRRKKELGYSYEQIANLAGLPVSTVQKALGGITKSPRYDTLRALENVLKSNGFEETGNGHDAAGAYPEDIIEHYSFSERGSRYTASEIAVYGVKPGRHITDEYFSKPKECREELLDGKFCDYASNTYIHQLIVLRLGSIFFDYLEKNKKKGIPLIAPVDVIIDKDSKTALRPDFMVLCDMEKYKSGVIYGAPDLIAEVLSKDTKSKDYILKLNKYWSSGVREYWIVDPEKKKVAVYKFDGEFDLKNYGESEPVPVGIFDNELKIDFAGIFETAFSWEKQGL